MKDLAGELSTYLFITLDGPLPPDSYGALINPSLGLLPQTPAWLGQVEEEGGPKRGRPRNMAPYIGAPATAGPPSGPT